MSKTKKLNKQNKTKKAIKESEKIYAENQNWKVICRI